MKKVALTPQGWRMRDGGSVDSVMKGLAGSDSVSLILDVFCIPVSNFCLLISDIWNSTESSRSRSRWVFRSTLGSKESQSSKLTASVNAYTWKYSSTSMVRALIPFRSCTQALVLWLRRLSSWSNRSVSGPINFGSIRACWIYLNNSRPEILAIMNCFTHFAYWNDVDVLNTPLDGHLRKEVGDYELRPIVGSKFLSSKKWEGTVTLSRSIVKKRNVLKSCMWSTPEKFLWNLDI